MLTGKYDRPVHRLPISPNPARWRGDGPRATEGVDAVKGPSREGADDPLAPAPGDRFGLGRRNIEADQPSD